MAFYKWEVIEKERLTKWDDPPRSDSRSEFNFGHAGLNHPEVSYFPDEIMPGQPGPHGAGTPMRNKSLIRPY